MGSYSRLVVLSLAALLAGREVPGQEDFRVPPYLQNPAPDAMSVIWFTGDSDPGTFMYRKKGTGEFTTVYPVPALAEALAYPDWEESSFFGGDAPPVPYRQRVRLEGLEPGTTYEYTLIQGLTQFNGEFRTAPAGDTSVRFIIYADSETEPESHGKFTDWPDPVTGFSRPYLVDQAMGYRNNLEAIRSREPDLVFIAGDLVESGGEQRDWDEFWLNNATRTGSMGMAARVPLLAALGNHEYYNGPLMEGYDQPGSEQAVSKYLSYFEYPANHADK